MMANTAESLLIKCIELTNRKDRFVANVSRKTKSEEQGNHSIFVTFREKGKGKIGKFITKIQVDSLEALSKVLSVPVEFLEIEVQKGQISKRIRRLNPEGKKHEALLGQWAELNKESGTLFSQNCEKEEARQQERQRDFLRRFKVFR